MLGVLARGLRAVVAGRAGARNYSRVVETGGLPSRGGMAGVALLHGGNMGGYLTGGCSAVMAG